MTVLVQIFLQLMLIDGLTTTQGQMLYIMNSVKSYGNTNPPYLLNSSLTA